MLRASVSGAIDYSKFDVRDPLAEVREAAILSFLESDGMAKYTLEQAHLLSAMGASPSCQSPSDIMAHALELVTDATRSAYPYIENGGKKRKRGNERERWAAQFGDLNDPVVQLKVKEAEQKMLESARESRAIVESAAKAALRSPVRKQKRGRAVSG